MRKLAILSALILSAALVLARPAALPAGAEAFLGNWDVAITRPDGTIRSCWMEVTPDGDHVKMRFLFGGGSPVPVLDFKFEDGALTFERKEGPRESPHPAAYVMRVKSGRLEGTISESGGAPRAFTGVRPPKWRATLPKVQPGSPVALFNGKDTSGWRGQYPDRPLKWRVQDGILLNDPPANNIYSEKKFWNFKVEVEFNVAQHSNSGVYLRGRHEIQIQDDYGKPVEEHIQGSIYSFIAPSVNASKPAGEWQTLEATIIENHVTVILNGTTIIDDKVIPALTGGALDPNEGEPGPIMLQGDHGLVKYRKVVVTPLT